MLMMQNSLDWILHLEATLATCDHNLALATHQAEEITFDS